MNSFDCLKQKGVISCPMTDMVCRQRTPISN